MAQMIMAFLLYRVATAVRMAISTVSATTVAGGVPVSTIATTLTAVA